VLAVMYLLLTRRQVHCGKPASVGMVAAVQTHKK
jgi:hypothetical protein